MDDETVISFSDHATCKSPRYPYGNSRATLRRWFEDSEAFKQFVADPSRAPPEGLNRAIWNELFGSPLPKPSCMAVGWKFYDDAGVVLGELLRERGLYPRRENARQARCG
jgi:hypothetical protein